MLDFFKSISTTAGTSSEGQIALACLGAIVYLATSAALAPVALAGAAVGIGLVAAGYGVSRGLAKQRADTPPAP